MHIGRGTRPFLPSGHSRRLRIVRVRIVGLSRGRCGRYRGRGRRGRGRGRRRALHIGRVAVSVRGPKQFPVVGHLEFDGLVSATVTRYIAVMEYVSARLQTHKCIMIL